MSTIGAATKITESLAMSCTHCNPAKDAQGIGSCWFKGAILCQIWVCFCLFGITKLSPESYSFGLRRVSSIFVFSNPSCSQISNRDTLRSWCSLRTNPVKFISHGRWQTSRSEPNPQIRAVNSRDSAPDHLPSTLANHFQRVRRVL